MWADMWVVCIFLMNFWSAQFNDQIAATLCTNAMKMRSKCNPVNLVPSCPKIDNIYRKNV